MTKGIRITPTVLKRLGCKLSEGVWYMRSHGYEFRFVAHNTYWRFFTPSNQQWHTVDHLDECIALAFKDGVGH